MENRRFNREIIESLLLPAPSRGNPDRRVAQAPLAQWPRIDAHQHDISYGILEARTMNGLGEDRDTVLGVAVLDFEARLKATADPSALENIQADPKFKFQVPVVVARATERFGGEIDLYKRTDGLRFFPIGDYSNERVPTFPLFTPTGAQKKNPTFYVTDYGHELAVDAKKDMARVQEASSTHAEAEALAWEMAGHPLRAKLSPKTI